jgi:hypothetical protein
VLSFQVTGPVLVPAATTLAGSDRVRKLRARGEKRFQIEFLVSLVILAAIARARIRLSRFTAITANKCKPGPAQTTH